MTPRGAVPRRVLASLLCAFACTTASCGSGGGGGGAPGGSGLVLVSFVQASEDSIPLNQILELQFSGDLDPDSVSPASVQVRQGPSFGAAVEGRYVVVGSRVFFEPRLPGLCDLSDSGLRPGTDYRVLLIGHPEEFSVRDRGGSPLEATASFTFRTREETHPLGLFDDHVPGVAPTVVDHSPRAGAHPPLDPDVSISPDNQVTVDFSENVDPCTITPDTVMFEQWATGDSDDRPNGFTPDSDQTPGDPYSWGSGVATTPPKRVRATYVLSQTFLSTRLRITPDFGEYPDNALLVVTLTNDVRDLGGRPLVPTAFGFVTENRGEQCAARTLRFDGDVPIDANVTTAEVDTTRAPDRAQGFLLFVGDGDNGAALLSPSGPDCEGFSQENDGNPDDFDTATGVDLVLDTGASENVECDNTTDGSKAVVFEYRTFRIRSGRTVRVVGRNAAIILVRGDVLIEQGGRLLVRSDSGNGASGVNNSPLSQPAGGLGVAGGGSGGAAVNGGAGLTGTVYSRNGEPGIGSPDYLTPAGSGGGDPVLVGPGRGAVSLGHTGASAQDNKNGAGGGGGGHSTPGGDGQSTSAGGNTPRFYEGTIDGEGGDTYGDASGSMPTPEAGSGGGGAGYVRNAFASGTFYSSTGGAGGAGGGFVDLTAGGDIRVLGTIDAAGGRGGGGASPTTFRAGSGGGGGGAGGGVRLLTPGMIELGNTTTINAGSGTGGAGVGIQSPLVPGNNGGAGGFGRVVLEDDDSVITGIGGAVVIPAESSGAGFFRGAFDATRFQGGGLEPVLVTGLVDAGPVFPRYREPVQVYGGQEDFRAGIPAVASRGVGQTSMFVEVQGFPVRVDGTPDLTQPSGWKHVGYFTDSGSETFPTWHLGRPADVTVPADGTAGGFAAVDGREFVQFRVTFYLRAGVGPFDPGPYLDDWTLHFCYDQ